MVDRLDPPQIVATAKVRAARATGWNIENIPPPQAFHGVVATVTWADGEITVVPLAAVARALSV
jgi:hypothetical protein